MKIAELQKKLREKKIDVAILYNMETNRENFNMSYLASFPGYGFLLIPSKSRPFLVTTLLDAENALKSRIKFHFAKGNFMKIIKKKLKKPKVIGVEMRNFSLFAQQRFKKEYKNIKFVDITEILEELRMVKTKKEIKIIKEASKISNKILESCIKNFGKFRTEKDVYNYLRIECINHHVEPSFEFVVAAGRSPSSPHHIPKNKRLSRGFCIIDFGIRHKGYCTDVTRTLFIGKPSQREKELYDLVLSAQKNAINSIKVGKDFSELDLQVREELGKHAKKFVHALGHGLGIEVHEKPLIHKDIKNIKIKNGMCFTIEPGIYSTLRYGIRIEDDIIVEKNKPMVLSKIPKELRIVKPKTFK